MCVSRMIKDKTVLALIPARGGSKGLPGKNIKNFLGKPLICWPIQLALSSRYIDKVVVSTDSEEIAGVAVASGAEVSRRPEILAGDTAIVADVVRFTIKSLANERHNFDYIILLEATSPMRTLQLVDSCIEKIIEEDADSVATFNQAEPPPTRLWKISGNKVEPYITGADPWLPRQQQDNAYHLNGLLYLFKVKTFLEGNINTLFVGKGVPVITDIKCIDIDTQEDFDIAELILRNRT